jgi:hypothetical protein
VGEICSSETITPHAPLVERLAAKHAVEVGTRLGWRIIGFSRPAQENRYAKRLPCYVIWVGVLHQCHRPTRFSSESYPTHAIDAQHGLLGMDCHGESARNSSGCPAAGKHQPVMIIHRKGLTDDITDWQQSKQREQFGQWHGIDARAQ